MVTWKVIRGTTTSADIIEYKKLNGADAAKILLTIAGPDGFDGSIDDYNKLMATLEKEASDADRNNDCNSSNKMDI